MFSTITISPCWEDETDGTTTGEGTTICTSLLELLGAGVEFLKHSNVIFVSFCGKKSNEPESESLIFLRYSGSQESHNNCLSFCEVLQYFLGTNVNIDDRSSTISFKSIFDLDMNNEC